MGCCRGEDGFRRDAHSNDVGVEDGVAAVVVVVVAGVADEEDDNNEDEQEALKGAEVEIGAESPPPEDTSAAAPSELPTTPPPLVAGLRFTTLPPVERDAVGGALTLAAAAEARAAARVRRSCDDGICTNDVAKAAPCGRFPSSAAEAAFVVLVVVVVDAAANEDETNGADAGAEKADAEAAGGSAAWPCELLRRTRLPAPRVSTPVAGVRFADDAEEEEDEDEEEEEEGPRGPPAGSVATAFAVFGVGGVVVAAAGSKSLSCFWSGGGRATALSGTSEASAPALVSPRREGSAAGRGGAGASEDAEAEEGRGATE